MKKTFILGLFAFAIVGSSLAQEERVVKKEVKEIKKEVNVEESNGVKTVTISTIENGNKTEEVYTGVEADKKLAELNESAANEGAIVKEKSIEKEVKVEEVDGVKKLTIITKQDGRETIEVFEGAEADAKIKELENQTPQQKRAGDVIIKKEKKIVQKENM